jgi:hypothetical protein
MGIVGFLTGFWSVRGGRTHLATKSKRDLRAVGDRCRNHRSIRTFGNAGPNKTRIFPFTKHAFWYRLIWPSFAQLKLLAPTTLRYQVSHSSATRPARDRILPVSRRSRRRPVFLEPETLETRQLLSVASVDLNQIVAQPGVGTTPTPLLSSLYPSGLSPTPTIFPAPFPNIVVVVVPVGLSRVVVIVPTPIISHSPFASNTHPVQPETPSSVGLPSPTPTTLNSFGQISTVDTLSWRTSRFGSEPEVAALIDVVEPFQAPVPGIAPNKAATRSRTEATVMLPSVDLPFLPRLDHAAASAERLGADLSCPSPAAALLPEVSREDESPTASPAPRLAFAAALAGAGYWLTLRDFKGRNPGWGAPRSDRALRPRVRRWSLVPR